MSDLESRRRLASMLLASSGMKVDADDPAFILVELNRLILEEEAKKAVDAIARAGDQAHDKFLASADAWAAQTNEVLARFAEKTEELRAAIPPTSRAPSPPLAGTAAAPRSAAATFGMQPASDRLSLVIGTVAVLVTGLVLGLAVAFVLAGFR